MQFMLTKFTQNYAFNVHGITNINAIFADIFTKEQGSLIMGLTFSETEFMQVMQALLQH